MLFKWHVAPFKTAMVISPALLAGFGLALS